MVILGVNGVSGIFHDASATLIVDGEIVASVEEERFNRSKHSSGIPFEAIRFCLRRAGIEFKDVDHIGYYLDPPVLRQLTYTEAIAKFGADPQRVDYYRAAAERIERVPTDLAGAFSFGPQTNFHFLNHHLAHAASAYFASGRDAAAVLTIDGCGDRETSTLYHGCGRKLTKVQDFLVYPYSLGFIYTVIAHECGFGWIDGPGKMMGLAGYGTPDPKLFDGIVHLNEDPRRPIDIDVTYFDYHLGGSSFSAKGRERFGPPTERGAPFSPRDLTLAASAQHMLEQAVVHLAKAARKLLPEVATLCYAGGVALNVCANRRILDSGAFGDLFVSPPAYDGGTSLGCALHLWSEFDEAPLRPFDVYSGPDIVADYAITDALAQYAGRIKAVELSEADLYDHAARLIADNRIIGWAQGRMECGPRALGNRSVLTNAANSLAKDEMNKRFKRREPFRPYAPSVLAEECAAWFDVSESKYMLLEADVHDDKRARVPGIVHIDGTARPQSVSAEDNPRFHRLLRRFHELTGIPMVLNTSFNMHGEPIVNTPAEAIHDLLSTDLDAVFVGDYYITKVKSREEAAGQSKPADPPRAAPPRPTIVRPRPVPVCRVPQAPSEERRAPNWENPFAVLRNSAPAEPTSVVAGVLTRLADLGDDELLNHWLGERERAVTGDGFGERGWCHLMYRESFRGSRVLDFCGGLGIDGVTFAQHGAAVTFADAIAGRLRAIERICSQLELAGTGYRHLEHADALDELPTDFDVIWCHGALSRAPFAVARDLVQKLLEHLPMGGRLIGWVYPRARWEHDGRLSFDQWAGKLDAGAPWAEWYDPAKLEALLHPAEFNTVLSVEYHNAGRHWFDLVRRK